MKNRIWAALPFAAFFVLVFSCGAIAGLRDKITVSEIRNSGEALPVTGYFGIADNESKLRISFDKAKMDPNSNLRAKFSTGSDKNQADSDIYVYGWYGRDGIGVWQTSPFRTEDLTDIEINLYELPEHCFLKIYIADDRGMEGYADFIIEIKKIGFNLFERHSPAGMGWDLGPNAKTRKMSFLSTTWTSCIKTRSPKKRLENLIGFPAGVVIGDNLRYAGRNVFFVAGISFLFDTVQVMAGWDLDKEFAIFAGVYLPEDFKALFKTDAK